jgi:hypothetical protein
MTYGLALFFLDCQYLSVTSMSCSGLIYLPNLQVEKLLLATTKWMAMTVHLAIILPTTSIHLEQHLWRSFKSTKNKTKKLNLWKHRKHAERILKDLLVLCKLGLPLFVVHLVFWDKKNLINIMTACVILHNMIIKDERIWVWNSSLTILVAEWDPRGTRSHPCIFWNIVKLKTRPRILSCKTISSRTIGSFTGQSDALIIHSFDFLFMYVWDKQLFALKPFVICLIICLKL